MSRFSLISINAIYFFDSLHIASMLSNCTVKCECVKGVLCCNTGFLANCSYYEDSKYGVLKSMLRLTISENEDGANDHKDNPEASYPTSNPNPGGSIRNCEETKELDQKCWHILRHISSAPCSLNLTSVVLKSPVRLHWNNPVIVQFDHQHTEIMSQILTSFQKRWVANLFLTSKTMLVFWLPHYLVTWWWMTHDNDKNKTSPAQCKPCPNMPWSELKMFNFCSEIRTYSMKCVQEGSQSDAQILDLF